MLTIRFLLQTVIFSNAQHPTSSADPHSSLGIYVQLIIRSSGKKPDLLRNNSKKSMNQLQSSAAQWFCVIHRKKATTDSQDCTRNKQGISHLKWKSPKVSEYYMESRHRNQWASSYWSISVEVLLSHNAALNKQQWTQNTICSWVLSESSKLNILLQLQAVVMKWDCLKKSTVVQNIPSYFIWSISDTFGKKILSENPLFKLILTIKYLNSLSNPIRNGWYNKVAECFHLKASRTPALFITLRGILEQLLQQATV